MGNYQIFVGLLKLLGWITKEYEGAGEVIETVVNPEWHANGEVTKETEGQPLEIVRFPDGKSMWICSTCGSLIGPADWHGYYCSGCGCHMGDDDTLHAETREIEGGLSRENAFLLRVIRHFFVDYLEGYYPAPDGKLPDRKQMPTWTGDKEEV